MIITPSAFHTAWANPSQPEVSIVEKLIQEKNWIEAEKFLKLHYEKDRKSLSVLFQLAEVIVRQGRRIESIHLLQNTLNSQHIFLNEIQKSQIRSKIYIISRLFLSNSVFQTFEDGFHLIESKKYRYAQDKFKKALQSEPDHVEILVRLAQAEVLNNEPENAIPRLRKALTMNADDPWIMSWLGRALWLKGEKKESLQFLRTSLKIVEESETIVFWLAEALVSLKKVNEALKILDEDQKKYPFHLENLLYSANLRIQYFAYDAHAVVQAQKDLRFILSQLSIAKNSLGLKNNDLSLKEGKMPEQLKKEVEIALQTVQANKLSN